MMIVARLVPATTFFVGVSKRLYGAGVLQARRGRCDDRPCRAVAARQAAPLRHRSGGFGLARNDGVRAAWLPSVHTTE